MYVLSWTQIFLNLIYITFFDKIWTLHIIYISYSWKNWSILCTKNYDFALKGWQGDRSQVRKLLLKEIMIFSKEIIYFFSSNFKWSYWRNSDFYLSNHPLKESYRKNFDFCMSNCPLKERNQNYFDFCWSNCPLKESYRKNFDFAWHSVLWKKVIKETLIFVCQIVLWKKKNLHVCLLFVCFTTKVDRITD